MALGRGLSAPCGGRSHPVGAGHMIYGGAVTEQGHVTPGGMSHDSGLINYCTFLGWTLLHPLWTFNHSPHYQTID